jgi:hypothetical protein
MAPAMPAPPPACTFDGTAAEVHVRGDGPAVLTRREAFSAPYAASVDLSDAQVGFHKTGAFSLEHPRALTPVNDNLDGAPYDVTYTSGPSLTVRIDAGGKPGSFSGPGCDPDCAILWGAGPKVITLDPARPAPIVIAEELPFGDRDPDAPSQPHLIDLSLAQATGTLRCDGHERPVVARDLTWKTGARHTGPIELRPAGLHLIVTSDGPPDGLPLLDAGPLLAARLGAGTLLLVLAAAVLRYRHRPPAVHPPPPAAIAPMPTPPPLSPAPALPFTFPPPVLDAYRDKKLAILFGSGLSMARDVAGGFPRWNDLPERLLEHAARQGVWTPAQIDAKRAFFSSGHVSLEVLLSELDSLKTALRGARKYQTALNQIFRPTTAAPGDVHRALVDLGVGVLLTTNYDPLLELVEGPPCRGAYTWKDADKALSDIQDGRKVLLKIHGTADNEDTVVMTRGEYDKAAAHLPYQRAMSFLLQSYTFLLVGYGINDPLDLDLVFGLNTAAFGSAARTHYALMKDASPTDRDRWQRDLNVQVVPYQEYADLPGILRALRAAAVSAKP